MEASKLSLILDQHRLWIITNGVQGERAVLRDTNLEGADLSVANLSGANLEYANLCYANLSGANLNGAYLNGANLCYANLTGANLEYANLQGADLRVAILRGANLKGANLEYANLQGADLRVAILRGANLKDAILRGAVLSGAYLKDATGLPNVSWIIPGCLVHLNNIMDHIFYNGFYLEKENKFENFVQDSFGFVIQDNPIEKTFDMLAGDRIIRNIPDWVKYTGLKQIASELV